MSVLTWLSLYHFDIGKLIKVWWHCTGKHGLLISSLIKQTLLVPSLFKVTLQNMVPRCRRFSTNLWTVTLAFNPLTPKSKGGNHKLEPIFLPSLIQIGVFSNTQPRWPWPLIPDTKINRDHKQAWSNNPSKSDSNWCYYYTVEMDKKKMFN